MQLEKVKNILISQIFEKEIRISEITFEVDISTLDIILVIARG